MSTAASYRPHYTVTDYMQWKGDWELWRGTAVSMTPSPHGVHERVVSNLNFQLQSSIRSSRCNCRVYTTLDWLVSKDTIVRPDVMVVCGDQPERFLTRPPCFVAEVVSLVSLERDRLYKRDLYAEYHVAFYLLADPETQTTDLFRLCENQYEPLTVSEVARIDLTEECTIELRLDELYA